MTRNEHDMSREEAIDLLDTLIGMIEDNHESDYDTALKMGIKALEQEPCEDAISRQAVLDGLASIAKAKAKSDAQKSLMGRVMFFTEQLPSVKPQEPTGHWIEDTNGTYTDNHDTWECSECGNAQILLEGTPKDNDYNYCPNCGAKMN